MPYLAHYGLRAHPFPLTPNTRQFYATDRAQEILTSLEFGVSRNAGLMKVVGDIGTGKTLLCRLLLRRLEDTAAVAYLNAPQTDPDALVALVCREFGLPASGDRGAMLAALNAFLIDVHANGQDAVLVVDEAQSLGAAGLETIRLLSNLETENHKLLQIILFGQDELDVLLARGDLRQVAQRVAFAFSTVPLNAEDGANYVLHRLRLARQEGVDWAIFEPKALSRLVAASGGVPRVINILADKALLAAYADSARTVGPDHVKAAMGESRNLVATATRGRTNGWAVAAGLGGILIGALVSAWVLQSEQTRADLRDMVVAGAAGETEAPASAPAPVSTDATTVAAPPVTAVDKEVVAEAAPVPVATVAEATPVKPSQQPEALTPETLTPVVSVAVPRATPPEKPVADTVQAGPEPSRKPVPVVASVALATPAAPVVQPAAPLPVAAPVVLPVVPQVKPAAPVKVAAPPLLAAKPAVKPAVAVAPAPVVKPAARPVAAPAPVPASSAAPAPVRTSPAVPDPSNGQPRQGARDKDGRWVWQ